MADNNFMERIRSFFGLRQEPPRNDFRNPIWGSDDEDDGDELYSRSQMDLRSAFQLQREITRQVQDMIRSFSGMFGEVGIVFDEISPPPGAIIDEPAEPENFNNKNIRDYYLKSGYQNEALDMHKDMDLDGKVSSADISGLLKKKEEGYGPVIPFNDALIPGRSFCQTVITTSVTKPDGTIETRRIVKKGNGIVEETVTTTEPFSDRGPSSGPSHISTANNFFSSLSALLKNYH